MWSQTLTYVLGGLLDLFLHIANENGKFHHYYYFWNWLLKTNLHTRALSSLQINCSGTLKVEVKIKSMSYQVYSKTAATLFVPGVLLVVDNENAATRLLLPPIIQVLTILHCVDFLHEGLEAVPYIRVLESTRLHKQQLTFFCKLIGHMLGNLPLCRVSSLTKIQFISDEHNHYIGFCVLLYFVDPFLYRFKAWHLRNIVNN